MTTPDSASDLETLFPRIAVHIANQWGSAEPGSYLGQLLFDQRGGRQGFPEAIIADLLLLSLLHEALLQQNRTPDPSTLWNDPEYSKAAGEA